VKLYNILIKKSPFQTKIHLLDQMTFEKDTNKNKQNDLFY